VALYFEEVIPAKNGLGLATDFKLADARSWQAYDSLREFETYIGMRKYNLWWDYAGATASEVLAQKYGDKALLDYFAKRSTVGTWQEAFEKTFKSTPDDFYIEFDGSRSKIEGTATLKSSSLRPDPSICSENAPMVDGNRLVCLGSIVDETISSKPIYLFRVEGFNFSAQPVAVLDTIDARSNCNRKQWGRMEMNAQVMWIELEMDAGKCTVTLELPGNSISSSIVLGTIPNETATPGMDSFIPDSSVCVENETPIHDIGLVCLGSIVDKAISSGPIYLFRVEGFDFSAQPVTVLDTIDAQSNCNRTQWGRMEADGQIMWIELAANSGKCTITLNLPGDSISSSIELP
jgi:hypothetical protein